MHNGKRPYFEGWYFKHQRGDELIAFIPGIHRDEKMNSNAFIQVITTQESYYVEYPISQVSVIREPLLVKIGDSTFSEAGCDIHIETEDGIIEGMLDYGRLRGIAYPVMGPLSYIKHLECNHGILSMGHKVRGVVRINGNELNLNKGHGYIEGDWGYSFPKTYFWSQCNQFAAKRCNIVVAIADIPVGVISMQGGFAIIQYNGREYRLASYLGAHIKACTKQYIEIKQLKYRLQIYPKATGKQALLAPMNGGMSRIIHESAMTGARYCFWYKDKMLFDFYSNYASVEYVK